MDTENIVSLTNFIKNYKEVFDIKNDDYKKLSNEVPKFYKGRSEYTSDIYYINTDKPLINDVSNDDFRMVKCTSMDGEETITIVYFTTTLNKEFSKYILAVLDKFTKQ